MWTYILRRALWSIPILFGVNCIIFFLFFFVNSPDHIAETILGEKNIDQDTIDIWKKERGYHLPLFINSSESGLSTLTQTIYFQKSVKMLWFDFGKSDDKNLSINYEIRRRMVPSLMIAVPSFILGILVNITIAMIFAWYRGSQLDYWGLVICVILMSISPLFYIIAGQFVFGRILNLVPISGYAHGLASLKFTLMPVLIGIIHGIGGGVRFNRTIFLEVVNLDFIRTARAKGLNEAVVLYKHALKNAMIPILTTVVMTIPFLFMGSLIMENFFAIPGLGSFTFDALSSKDFAIVRSMVFLSAVLYVIGLIMTDISYSLVDPRVRFK